MYTRPHVPTSTDGTAYRPLSRMTREEMRNKFPRGLFLCTNYTREERRIDRKRETKRGETTDRERDGQREIETVLLRLTSART